MVIRLTEENKELESDVDSLKAEAGSWHEASSEKCRQKGCAFWGSAEHFNGYCSKCYQMQPLLPAGAGSYYKTTAGTFSTRRPKNVPVVAKPPPPERPKPQHVRTRPRRIDHLDLSAWWLKQSKSAGRGEGSREPVGEFMCRMCREIATKDHTDSPKHKMAIAGHAMEAGCRITSNFLPVARVAWRALLEHAWGGEVHSQTLSSLLDRMRPLQLEMRELHEVISDFDESSQRKWKDEFNDYLMKLRFPENIGITSPTRRLKDLIVNLQHQGYLDPAVDTAVASSVSLPAVRL